MVIVEFFGYLKRLDMRVAKPFTRLTTCFCKRQAHGDKQLFAFIQLSLPSIMGATENNFMGVTGGRASLIIQEV
jgi:hypothetical protein